MADTVLMIGGARPVAIRQTVTAGNQFDGTAPLTTAVPTVTSGLVDYPAAGAGGLFRWTNLGENPYQVLRILEIVLDFGGVAVDSWALDIVEDGQPDNNFVEGGVDPGYLDRDPQLQLHPGQSLKLTTVGATAELTATITAVSDEN